MSQKILLESGTNEMEMLVFRVAHSAYGINVAKVKEIIRHVKPVRLPLAPPAIDGSIKLREEVLTLINLATFLGVEPEAKSSEHRLIIIVEFDKMRCGVLVDAVEMIHRIGWAKIEPPSEFLVRSGTPVVSMTMLGERVVQLLDFESIIGSLLGGTGTTPPEQVSLTSAPHREDVQVLAVDDSFTIRASLKNMLTSAGFEHLTLCTDGQHAWETLEAAKRGEVPLPDIILSDIEMPRMDGLYLTLRIKDDAQLQKIPVVLFSSIIRKETQNKGEAVGADAQITKFDVNVLLDTMDRLLQGQAVPAG